MKPLNQVLNEVFHLRNHTKEQYIHDVKLFFNVKGLCRYLGINRNRYYYLKRQGKLDEFIGGYYEK